MNRSLPEGCTPKMVDDQCGPDEYEIDDDVIRDAVDLAQEEIVTEYIDDQIAVLKVALLPLAEYAIKARIDDYLENYKLEGTFK